MRGHHYEPITEEVKERFLDLIAQGYTRPEAAAALDTSARQLRALCNPASHRYDENFHRCYQQITAKGGEHEHALAERLESAAVERGLRSSDRLLEKLLVVYHPEWKVHRPQGMPQLNVNIDEVKMLFQSMSDETLQRVIAELESKEQPALPVIDADAA